MNRNEDFKRLRRIGWRASDAFDAAKTRELFEADENVRLEIVADDSPETVLDFDGTAQQIEHERQRAEQLGVWGMIGKYRLDETFPWTHADSVWGFVGDDWKDSGYDTDIMANTLQALTDAQVDDDARRECYAKIYGLQRGDVLDDDEIHALSRILEAIKPHWRLTDL